MSQVILSPASRAVRTASKVASAAERETATEVSPIAPEPSEIPEEATPAEETAPARRKKAPAEPLQRTYKTGTKIAAFIFFVITAGIFVIYEYLAFSFLYLPLLESIDSFAEAIGAIFGYIFGLIYTLVFAGLQLPANIAAIILFKRIRGKSDKAWENVLFTVLFILTIVMLVVTILSTVLFFAMSALGG